MEYLIDSITSKDSTLQASIGLVHANTNNMRNDFEGAANILIEIDTYRRSKRTNTRNANVSAIDFSAGRGNTGVDLRFHPKHKFLELTQEQRDELTNSLSTNDGKKANKVFFLRRRRPTVIQLEISRTSESQMVTLVLIGRKRRKLP